MRNFGRRNFLRIFGLGTLGSTIAASVQSRATADGPNHVFAESFLEDATVTTVAPGHYDPKRKLFVSDETNEPLLAQRMTSTMTSQYYDTCRAYDAQMNCTHWDSDRGTSSLDFNESDS